MQPKKPKTSIFCKRGHRKSGRNLILRHKDGKEIKECRQCARDAQNANREAKRRNAKLLDPRDW